MTDPERQRATSAAADDARADGAHRLLLLLGIVGVLGVLVLGGALFWSNGKLNDQGAQITALQSSYDKSTVAERALADQVRGLGHIPVVQPPAPAQGPSGPQGLPGPGPTQAQIDQAVTGYLAAHPPAPGQNVTPAMVATAVAAYLTTNPPQAGRPPTPDEISAAASTYIAGHASDFRGTAGQDATDAQVAAAVATYCDAHGSCAGPAGQRGTPGTPGADGAQGVSITDLTFGRDGNGRCQVIVTLHDPATGKDTQVTHAAGDAACPLLPGSPLKIARN